MLITINNPTLENAEKTIITSPVAPLDTHLYVKSSQGFSNSQYTIIGEPGAEKTEIKQINAAITDDLGIDIEAIEYSHNEGDPVYYARYNQIKIYKATTLAGAYSLLDTIDIDVDNKNLETVYDDTTGLATDYYKISYYNSQTTLESSLSDPIPGGGISTNTVRYITDAILEETQDKNESITNRQEILDWMNDCQADVRSRRRKWSFLYTRAVSSRVADRSYYTLSSDFNVTNVETIDHLDYNYNNGSTTDITYRLRYVPKEEFDYQTEDNDAQTDDNTQIWTWDEATDYLWINPIPDTDQATAYYLYYYKSFSDLETDGDTPQIPDTTIYKYFCLSRFFVKKQDQQRSQYFQTIYERAVSTLARRERKEIGQPYGFKFNKDNIRRYYKY
jgi:hypothetical protein